MLVTADQGGHSRAPQILRDTTDTSRYQVDTHPIPLDYHVRARVSPPSSSEESSRVRQSLTCTGRPPFLLGTPPLANNSPLIFNTFREGSFMSLWSPDLIIKCVTARTWEQMPALRYALQGQSHANGLAEHCMQEPGTVAV